LDQIKFIVWADIHWDKFGAKCVTLEDTEKIEREIFEKAQKENFDFTLFAGDRYLKREPDDEVKVKADRVIFDIVHKGTVPHFHLIGNHDWTDRGRKWNTSESLKIFNNVYVLDTSKTVGYKNVRIHALPADYQFDLSKYQIDKSCFNIFVFHDVVRGTYMDEERTRFFETGLNKADFDISDFDIVFAGDIHVRQQFVLKNTVGGYLGSVIQRTRADANVERGWTEVVATKENDKWVFDTTFFPTANLFSRISFNVVDETKFEDLSLVKPTFEDQFVEIKLVGDKKNVDRIAEDLRWKKIEKEFNARCIDIFKAYETEQSEVVVDLSTSNSVIGDLELYLSSEFSSLGSLKAEDIISTVGKIKVYVK